MKDFNLRAEPNKISQLNRPLLLTLSAVVFFLLCWALISALESPKPSNKTLNAINGRSSNPPISPVLAELPKNYQDVNGIKKYLSQDQTLPPAVSDELNRLRTQQAALQAQLAQMQSGGDKSSASSLDARKSDLFFAAGKPPASTTDDSAAAKAAAAARLNNLANASNPYNQQNMQGQKKDFLADTTNQGDIYNHYKMITPISPYEVQSGTIIAANLLTAINTSLPGDIIAQVRQDVYDTVSGQYLLIPKGSKLLGKYDSSVAYGQERVLIAFDRIMRPDGTSIQLSNFSGGDEMGSAGFEGNVDGHWGKILGAATISTMLSFGAGVAADHNTNGNNYYPGAQQSAILGGAGSIAQTGQTLTNRAIDVQPTLTVPAGFNFSVIVNKDMVLAPYTSKSL